jgi:hypothetical protein
MQGSHRNFDEDTPVTAHNVVHHSPQHPSQITLTVVPRACRTRTDPRTGGYFHAGAGTAVGVAGRRGGPDPVHDGVRVVMAGSCYGLSRAIRFCAWRRRRSAAVLSSTPSASSEFTWLMKACSVFAAPFRLPRSMWRLAASSWA